MFFRGATLHLLTETLERCEQDVGGFAERTKIPAGQHQQGDVAMKDKSVECIMRQVIPCISKPCTAEISQHSRYGGRQVHQSGKFVNLGCCDSVSTPYSSESVFGS